MEKSITCKKCGKSGYKNTEALIRHQKRSKICNSITKLPETQLSLEQQLNKIGMKLIKK